MKNEPTSARSSRRSAGLQSALNLALVIFILLAVNYLGFKYYAHKRPLRLAVLHPLRQDEGRAAQPRCAGPHHHHPDRQARTRSYWEQTENLLKEYQRVGGKNVTLEKVDPVYDRARAVELQDRIHFAGTDNLIIFEYKDREPRS